MKTRNSFVSNSSSSSFIINGNFEITEDFVRLISHYVFNITLSNVQDIEELHKKIIEVVDTERKLNPDRAKYIYLDQEDDWISVGGIIDGGGIEATLELAKEYKASVRLNTGGTSSEILPQAMIQSHLIDAGIIYTVEGDGSFDLRVPAHIMGILKDYDYPGPAGTIMKYYHGQFGGIRARRELKHYLQIHEDKKDYRGPTRP